MPSEPPIPHDITELLHLWKGGDRDALQQVVTLAYDDLRAIALGYLQRGGRAGTLQATGLVNELYLKLAQVRCAAIKDRQHFYAFAAQLMRMILIDYSRQAKALKRPSSAERVATGKLNGAFGLLDVGGPQTSLNACAPNLPGSNQRQKKALLERDASCAHNGKPDTAKASA